jgi:hypothetical protein
MLGPPKLRSVWFDQLVGSFMLTRRREATRKIPSLAFRSKAINRGLQLLSRRRDELITTDHLVYRQHEIGPHSRLRYIT